MVDRYPGQKSEYGGGDGSPQRGKNGEYLDLPGIASAAGERARLMRMAGINDYDPSVPDTSGLLHAVEGVDVTALSFAEREAYEADLKIARARALQRAKMIGKTNGYSEVPEAYVGEEGSGSGVTTDMSEGNAAP